MKLLLPLYIDIETKYFQKCTLVQFMSYYVHLSCILEKSWLEIPTEILTRLFRTKNGRLLVLEKNSNSLVILVITSWSEISMITYHHLVLIQIRLGKVDFLRANLWKVWIFEIKTSSFDWKFDFSESYPWNSSRFQNSIFWSRIKIV